jgi:hypothetical protein
MLVTSFVSGVRDLVVTPSTAFINSPTDPSLVGIGVAKGTISLLSHSASGFFAMMAKLSATAGQALATLSLDPDFSNWHREKVLLETTNINRHWKKRGVQSVGAMVMRPFGDLVIGAAGGIFGIVISPVKGYRRNGTAGLVKGIAVGGIGVITRPVIGVLDAFAHFTASIHDIAKSVNVLERRLQPAHRIHLPHTFGMLGVLIPFDKTMAHAAHLLKVFPLKKSRRTYQATPETMVHVEVLPNIGTDTFAIATTARVILIRVKKEASGILSPSLCWELHFSPDTMISSRVADHGHSGVALTITLTKSEPAGNQSREKSSTNLVSSPDSQSTPWLHRLSTSQIEMPEDRSVDFTSPGEALPQVDLGNLFDYQAGRGKKGERLEWFTLLAEYQYRRQLGRLHNAICCVVGNFDAILRDPALGHRGDQNTEGYTTFGIYHFAKYDSGRTLASRSSVNDMCRHLESLPWVSDGMFRDLPDKSPHEQLHELSTARHYWDFSKQLEASKEEGGPEWLIAGRAWAVFPDEVIDMRPRTSPADTEADPCAEATRRVTWNPNDLSSTSPFAAAADQANKGFGLTSPRYDKALGMKRLDEHSSNSSSSSNISNLSPQLGKFKGPQNSTHQTRKRAPDFSQSFVSAVGSLSDWADAAASLGTPVSVAGERNDFHESDSLHVSDGCFLSTRQVDVELSSNEDTDERKPAANETSNPPPSEDRFGRMEALMERLMIFNSEQALLHHAASQTQAQPSHDEIVLLRQEISELRSELQRRSAAEVNSAEIGALREELAMLKGQIQAGLQPVFQQPAETSNTSAPSLLSPESFSSALEDC